MSDVNWFGAVGKETIAAMHRMPGELPSRTDRIAERAADCEKLAMQLGELRGYTRVLEWALKWRAEIPAQARDELNEVLREGEK